MEESEETKKTKETKEMKDRKRKIRMKRRSTWVAPAELLDGGSGLHILDEATLMLLALCHKTLPWQLPSKKKQEDIPVHNMNQRNGADRGALTHGRAWIVFVR